MLAKIASFIFFIHQLDYNFHLDSENWKTFSFLRELKKEELKKNKEQIEQRLKLILFLETDIIHGFFDRSRVNPLFRKMQNTIFQ